MNSGSLIKKCETNSASTDFCSNLKIRIAFLNSTQNAIQEVAMNESKLSTFCKKNFFCT